MQLTEQERADVTSRVAALEARTGTQVVTVVVGKSDSYAEAPWKAFALGTGATALACVLWQLAMGGWSTDTSRTWHVLVMLIGGAFLALLAVLYSPFARLFVDRIRREVEVMQFAQSLFFQRGLDRTRGRVGMLVLVSVFERRVVILADEGFDGRIGAPDWAALTGHIAFMLRHTGPATALRTGLGSLEAMLLERGFCGPGTGNELPDAVVEARNGR